MTGRASLERAPVRSPFARGMALGAQRDQIRESIGFFVPHSSERLEGRDVMHIQLLSELRRAYSTVLADFIPQSSFAPRRFPRPAVVGLITASISRISFACGIHREPVSIASAGAEPATGGGWLHREVSTAGLARGHVGGRSEVRNVGEYRCPATADIGAVLPRPARVVAEPAPTRRAFSSQRICRIALSRREELVLAGLRASFSIQRASRLEFGPADQADESSNPVRGARYLSRVFTSRRAVLLSKASGMAERFAALLAFANCMALASWAPHFSVILPHLERLNMPSFASVAASPKGVC